MDWLSIGAPILGGLANSITSDEAPQMTATQRAWMNRMRDMYKWYLNYSKGIPGSDPMEQSAMASAQGLLGEQNAQGYQGLLSAMGAPGGPGASNSADAISNFQSNAAGTRANLSSQLFAQFMQNRFAARDKASNIAGQAYGMSPRPTPVQPNVDFSSLLGQMASQYAYDKALRNKSSSENSVTTNSPITKRNNMALNTIGDGPGYYNEDPLSDPYTKLPALPSYRSPRIG